MTKKTLTDIPMDIFMKHIFIYAFASESPPIYKKSYVTDYLKMICRCVQVCREWRKYFCHIDIWKFLFFHSNIHSFYENRLNQLTIQKSKKKNVILFNVN